MRWHGSATPAIEVLVDALNDRLFPIVERIYVADPADLKTLMTQWRSNQAARAAQVAKLAALGTTGTVDRIALNVMAHHGSVPEMLRHLGQEAVC